MIFKKIFRVVIIIFIISLLLKILYVVFFPQLQVSHDAAFYNELGRSLSIGDGFSLNGQPAVRRDPLYPVFLASIYFLFGHNYSAVRIVQAIISSLMVIFIYWIACEIFNEKIGLMASTAAAFYPAFILYSGLLLTETVFAFLLVIIILFLLRAIKNCSQLWAVASGLFMGLAILCRSEMLLFPLILSLGMIFLKNQSRYEKQKIVKLCVFFLLAAYFVVIPWTVRNYIIFNKVIPVSALGKSALWLGSHPDDWVEWDYNREPLKSLASELDFNKEDSWVALDEILFKEAIKNIKKYPFSYIRLSVKRFFRLWVGSHSNSLKGLNDSFIQSIRNHKYKIFFKKFFLLIVNMGLIALGLVGLYAERKVWRNFFPIILLIVYKTVIHMLVFGTPRYQVPLMPFVLIFSAIGILQIQKKTVLKMRNWGDEI